MANRTNKKPAKTSRKAARPVLLAGGNPQIAKADGARLLTGGCRAQGFERGCYMEPTAVLAPDNRARVCQEEIFGPFATFLVYDTLDDAIRKIERDANLPASITITDNLPLTVTVGQITSDASALSSVDVISKSTFASTSCAAHSSSEMYGPLCAS